MLTPDERAAIAKKEEELLESWFQQLCKEEVTAWLRAHQEDLATNIAELETEDAGYAALLWLAQLCDTNPIEALKIMRAKTTLTSEESEALAAWDQIKNKPIRKMSK